MRQVMAEFVEEFATAATAVDARPTAVMARFRRAQTAITSFSRPDNGAGVTVSKAQFEAWYRAKCVEAVEDPVCTDAARPFTRCHRLVSHRRLRCLFLRLFCRLLGW